MKPGKGPWTTRNKHYHYVCTECGHEICPGDKHCRGYFEIATETHIEKKHGNEWGPELIIKERGNCGLHGFGPGSM